MTGSSSSRREFFTGSAMALAGRTILAQTDKADYVEVETSGGRVRGQRGKGICTFKGIPYAGNVSGANRFKAAPPLQPWKGVRDALSLGAPSWQPGKTYYGVNEPAPDENCLFLNVWTPAADGRRRPVMVYNHGGGFMTGSGGG